MEDGSHPPFAYAAVHDSGRYTLVRLYGVCRKRKADGRGFQDDEGNEEDEEGAHWLRRRATREAARIALERGWLPHSQN